MAVSYAQLWLWTKRIIRFYLVFVLIVWLVSSCVLFYLLHASASLPPSPSSASPDGSFSSSPPLAGPYRVHALLHSSVDHLESRLTSLFTRTRAVTSRVLDGLDRSLHPSSSPHKPRGTGDGQGGIVGGLRRGADGLLLVVEEVVDLLLSALRHLIDEWLLAALDMLDADDADAARPLPWQQERLDAARGVQRQRPSQSSPPTASTPASAAEAAKGGGAHPSLPPGFPHVAAQPPLAPVMRPTPPLKGLVRRPLPDGSMLYLSPESSASEQFTTDMVAGDRQGKVGERRVLVSVKDGLLRVTWKGGGEGEQGTDVTFPPRAA